MVSPRTKPLGIRGAAFLVGASRWSAGARLKGFAAKRRSGEKFSKENFDRKKRAKL
jgi:hypothetical protein